MKKGEESGGNERLTKRQPGTEKEISKEQENEVR